MKLDLRKYIWRVMMLLAVVFVNSQQSKAQINTDQVMNIGRNAMYFEDYVLSIQYFNQVISMKPYLAEPYFYRGVAKLNLSDYKGAEEDCSLAIERNPFIVDAYQVRGVARQTLGKYHDAIVDYESGLKQFPEHKYFLINKAACEVEVKDYEAADVTFAKLIKIFPKYDRAYLGRAQLRLAQTDTVRALEDIDKCISLNKNEPNAFVLRSVIKMNANNDVKGALEDMNEAIKLEPHYAGYFINRAFMKYRLDDYFGAMADYDYAISLEPTNVTAYYNRALLRMEVNDNNKAIHDFSYVLKSDPGQVLARYNRASLYYKTGQYKDAIADYDELLKTYPNFQSALYARSECKRLSGDRVGGERDYNRARALYEKHMKTGHAGMFADKDGNLPKDETDADDGSQFESEDAVKNKFNTLLTVESVNGVKPEYDNKSRGRIQNQSMKIDNEPMFVLSYYAQANAIKENSYYMKEVDEANSSRLLQFVLQLTNRVPSLTEEQIQLHFNSIEYYNGMLATSQPRAVDYLGRAIDFMMVKNPETAIADLNRAIAMRENFTLAYFVRASARLLQIEVSAMTDDIPLTGDKLKLEQDAILRQTKEKAAYTEVLADLDKVLEHSPKNVYALYNKGCVYAKMGDATAAISSYTLALEEKTDIGEAYYNRGLAYLHLGNKEKGTSDLSKAGELGILPSYSVLKRMN